MSHNKIILIGNLGKDPELRYTPTGEAVCNFSLATNEKKRDKSGDYQDVTTWFKITLWRKQAENASKYLEKGRQVYIEGRLSLSEWTDRDGKNRTTLEVNATEMQFIGGGQKSESSGTVHENSPTGGMSASANDNQFDPGAKPETPADDSTIPF